MLSGGTTRTTSFSPQDLGEPLSRCEHFERRAFTMSFGDSVQSIHSLIGDSFSTSDDDEALASRCERAAGSGSADARFSSFFGIFLVTV